MGPKKKNVKGKKAKLRKEREFRLTTHVAHLAHFNDWNEIFPAFDVLPYWEMVMNALLADAHTDTQRVLNSMDLDPSVKMWKGHLISAAAVARHLIQQDLAWSVLNGLPTRIGFIHLVGSLGKGTAVSPLAADVDVVIDFKGFSAPQYPDLLNWTEVALRTHPMYMSIAERRAFYFFMPIVDPNKVDFDDRKLPEGMHENGGKGGISLVPMGKGQKAGYPWWKIENLVKNRSHYIHIPSVAPWPDVDIHIGGFESGFPPADSFIGLPPEILPFYSASASIEASKFIKGQPDTVITAIRALKSWVNVASEAKMTTPRESQMGKSFVSSFTLELMAVWVYRQASGGISSAKVLFSQVMDILTKNTTDWPRMTFSDYYDPSIASTLSPSIAWGGVQVLDPIQPWNNVAYASKLSAAKKPARMTTDVWYKEMGNLGHGPPDSLTYFNSNGIGYESQLTVSYSTFNFAGSSGYQPGHQGGYQGGYPMQQHQPAPPPPPARGESGLSQTSSQPAGGEQWNMNLPHKSKTMEAVIPDALMPKETDAEPKRLPGSRRATLL